MYSRFLLALPLLCLTVNADSVFYSNLPVPQPPNLPSLGYEATSTKEFGEMVTFTSDNWAVTKVIIGMSNWAYESQYEPVGTSSGFYLPMTLNLYEVGAANTVGALIASSTINAFIPWRPEPDPQNCAPGSNNNYLGANGTCYAGSLSTVEFTFPLVSMPGAAIYGVAYNTQHHGYNPTGVAGPYNSLNVALVSIAPAIGSDPLPGTAYWNTTHGPFYDDGGAGGVGVFRLDTNWNPYVVMAQFEGVETPEPATLLMLGGGLAVLLLRRRR